MEWRRGANRGVLWCCSSSLATLDHMDTTSGSPNLKVVPTLMDESSGVVFTEITILR
jgi:hypothetical protein